jgi:hypothetical protein
LSSNGAGGGISLIPLDLRSPMSRRLVTFVVIVLAGLGLYLPLLSRNYDLNGMAEATGVSSGRGGELFRPNHMLYRPIGYVVQQGLAVVGIHAGAVVLLQVLSAVFGALGLGFTYLMLDRLVENRSITIWTTLLLGVSWSYWTMSTDVYYLSFSAMFVAAALALFVRSKSYAAFAACGALAGLAILSFQANVFLLPGLAAAVFFRTPFPGTRIAVRWILVLWAGAAAVVGPVFVAVGILVYQQRTVADLLHWGTSYTGDALPMWGASSLDRVPTVIGTAFRSILGMELWMFQFFQARFNNGELPGWISIVGAIALAAGLFIAYRRAPAKPLSDDRSVAELLILYAIYVPFFFWWDATEPRWFNISNIFLAGLVAIIAARWSSWPYFKFALPSAVLILGGLNLATSALPRRVALSTPLRMAACVAGQMKQNDLFLATEWNWAGYLEHVHDRDVVSFLGDVANAGNKNAAMDKISRAIKERQQQGGTVYMIDVRSLPPEYMQWFTGQTALTLDDLLTYKGSRAFECVYSSFIRLDSF